MTASESNIVSLVRIGGNVHHEQTNVHCDPEVHDTLSTEPAVETTVPRLLHRETGPTGKSMRTERCCD